jgi:hypothetical protein
MTVGPLQQHESRFRERNLMLFAILGLLSAGRQTRRLVHDSCESPREYAAEGRSPATVPTGLLAVLGVVSLARSLEQHVATFAAEGRAKLAGPREVTSPRAEPLPLRDLMR